jgi:hypothetical protein
LLMRCRLASLRRLAGSVLGMAILLGILEPTQARLTPTALTDRIVAISARYRGTPYRRDPLGEGPTGAIDRDPLICTTGVDCQTYVEQVLAEAIAPRPADVLACLTRIRYHDGVVGFGTRNHYMVSDWLPHNRWLIRDLTDEVGGKTTRPMEKRIDRAAFFRAHGAPDLGRGIPPERSRTTYIPRAALPAVAARIPTAAVLIWVQDRPGIIAAHCGFAIRDAHGALLLRHASERLGRVVDEPLLSFARHASPHIIGVKVCCAEPLLDTGDSRR